MEQNRKTQKQVAEKYKGNLSYFKNPGLLRRTRFWLAFLTCVVGFTALYFYVISGEKKFYNSGPISSTHASVANDCQSCHQASNGELVRDQLIPLLTLWKNRIERGQNPFQETPHHFFAGLEIDSACASCHQGQTQHVPQWFSLAAMDYRPDIAMADGGSCSSCHQEHLGSGPMKESSASACIACHSDAHLLAKATQRLTLPGNEISQVAVNRRLEDGSVHFIPPVKAGHASPAFVSFADGHPDFTYQASGLKDPNVIRFNHKRHAQADIPLLNGKQMDCASCHQLAAGGENYLPVTYAANCISCHALQFDPEHAELVLPHGKPEEVRAYLRNLPYQYAELAKKKGLTSATDSRKFTFGALTRLKTRMQSGEDFEKQVFLTSNPYRSQNPAGERSYFPGCAYCHEVKQTAPANFLITQPAPADLWLGHGRFNHSAHTHVSCVECHNADKSAATSDIIMPTKASCVECHRPLDYTPTTSTTPANALGADAQRAHGGVRSDCATCHNYHPDARALRLLKTLGP